MSNSTNDKAPLHRTSAARRAELLRIRSNTFEHAERVKKALRTGWLTAEEIATHLDSREPHARLCAIREEQPLLDRWVTTLTATGNSRRVKAYRLTTRGTSHE